MPNAILLDHYTLPEKGVVDLHINWSFDIQITATEARQKVDHWLLDEVSTMIGAGEPMLVVDGTSVVWRVPVIFTAPHIGEVGIVGSIDIHIQTGVMDTSPACKETVLQRAEELSAKMPPYQPRATSTQTWLAQDPQPTITNPKAIQLP